MSKRARSSWTWRLILDRSQDVRQTPHGRLSQRNGLCQDPVPNARLQATRRGHVHTTPDDILNVERKTAEVEQRGVRTRSCQEIHVARLDRIATSYRTEHTCHASRAGTRPRESAPRTARRDPRSGDRSCCSGPGTTSPFPGTTCCSCPSPLHRTRGRDLSRHVMPGQPTGGNTMSVYGHRPI